MWVLKCAADSALGDPRLVTLNGFAGRQTWEWVPGAGTPELRAEAARREAEGEAAVIC